MSSPKSVPLIVVVVGTRPEVLKMIPVIDALKGQKNIQSKVVFTGQHDTLVSNTVQEMGFDPDINLNLMSKGQNLYDIVNKCMYELKGIIQDLRPNCIMIQGDTTTAFAASMVSFLEGIPLAHVEAGLRTYNMREPFPEEGYRRLIDVLSTYHFVPTQRAADNLLREGMLKGNIYITGNTIVDALKDIVPRCSTVRNPLLARVLENKQANLVLLTAHRRESFGKPLANIFRAVENLISLDTKLEIIYPVHPNPNVLEGAKNLADNKRIHLVDPLCYEDLLMTLKRVQLVLTDSGGIQEEAPSFGLHTIVMRNNTERHEGIDAGFASLVGTDPDLIVSTALDKIKLYKLPDERFDVTSNPYGDGEASGRIVDILASSLTGKPRHTKDWKNP